MKGPLNVFGVNPSSANPYAKFGFDANPFRPPDADVRAGAVPFFREYIESGLRQISTWVDDVHVRKQRQPLALVGNIGVGKTFVVGQLVHLLRPRAPQGVAVDSLVLSDAGYGKISVGGWLVMALDRLSIPSVEAGPAHPGILPLFRQIVSAALPIQDRGRVSRVLNYIRTQPLYARESLLTHLTTWLRRGALTDSQSRSLGLARRLDYEGELIPVVGEILTIARDSGLLETFFLFVDQLEDLFSKGLTPQKRSRVLTDLRAFIDVIDAGAPVGLLLTWAPSFDAEIRTQYPAVYTRLSRRRVELPLLEKKFAPAFTQTWMRNQKAQFSGVLTANELSEMAWNELRARKQLLPPGEKATPRDLLSALAAELDKQAGIGV